MNNGRISDIKNGNTFEAVSVAEPDELPPSGPLFHRAIVEITAGNKRLI